MLRALSDLHGYALEATDGVIGHIDEVYFDDAKWTIRYFVVKTGDWLATREILISPISLGRSFWETRTLKVDLTKEKVRNSPSIDLHKPVSRQHEAAFNAYYAWCPYWEGDDVWGRWGLPMMMAQPPAPDPRPVPHSADVDHHLRSSREVTGYHLHARDGKIGHIEDFIIDDQSWAIRYLAVNTSNWGVGHRVLLAPEWIADVRAHARLVEVAAPGDLIKHSPRWRRDQPITRAYEDELHDYYRQRIAWSKHPLSKKAPIEPLRRPTKRP